MDGTAFTISPAFSGIAFWVIPGWRLRMNGVPSLLDDAYGARLRPIVYHQPKTLETGIDIGITSCDKAGLGGPRAGLMAGRPDLVTRVLARAAELGLEARPTLAVDVCHSLQNFDPRQLQQEVVLGQKIYHRLCRQYGAEAVRQTGLGATITEEDAWYLVRSLGMSQKPLPLVPAEVTAGIGMYWLLHHGMITVNALGQPGSRVSLRFKPKPQEVERFGGLSALVAAIDDGIHWVARHSASVADLRRLLFGTIG
ncbi:MAG: hypothetical protein P1P89_00930 [Desulfobacterales bacterium]|nr:hypothetical protein [Desulfobacterales bacterium]